MADTTDASALDSSVPPSLEPETEPASAGVIDLDVVDEDEHDALDDVDDQGCAMLLGGGGMWC